MAPLPNIGQKTIAGVGAVGKAVSDSMKDAITTTAKAGMAGVIGPELLAMKSVITGGFSDFKGTLSQNYQDLLGATNDNNDTLSEIQQLNKENLSSINKLGTLTESGVVGYLKQVSDNTSYLAELKEDLAINQARDTLQDASPTFVPTNDNDIPQQEKEKKGMSPLLLAGLIIGGISAFVNKFLEALKVGTLKWIKAVGKLTGITALLTKLSESLKFDNIRNAFKGFYTNIANNLNRFKNMSIEAFKNARVAVAERLAALRTSILNVFKSEGMIGKTLATIARLPGMISNILQNPFDDLIAGMSQAFTKVRGYVNGLVKGFSLKPVFESLEKVWGFIKNNPIVSGLGKIGSLLGKFFYPLGVIISLFDGFEAGKEEFDKGEGFAAYFKGFAGGIGGFLSSFVGIPMDLIRRALAWVTEQLGWEKASEFLTGFSFSDLINKAFKILINGILEAAATVVGLISKKSATAIRALKMDIPDGDKSKAQSNNSNTIKDSSSQINTDTKPTEDNDKSLLGKIWDNVKGEKFKREDRAKAAASMVDDFKPVADKLKDASVTLNRAAASLNERPGVQQNNTVVAQGGSNNNNKTNIANIGSSTKSIPEPWKIMSVT